MCDLFFQFVLAVTCESYYQVYFGRQTLTHWNYIEITNDMV